MRLKFRVSEEYGLGRGILRAEEVGEPESMAGLDLVDVKRQFLEWLLNEYWVGEIELSTEDGKKLVSYRVSSDSYAALPLTKGELQWLDKQIKGS